jgi:enoyl-CoA hydratase/carnithine racemase
MRVTKEAILRLMLAGVPAGDDLARAAYGSKDFRIGVDAFVAKRQPQWTAE